MSDSILKNEVRNEEQIKGIAENSKEAFEQIYDQYFPSVLRHVLKNNGDESDARELFQNSLMILWLEIKEGRFQQSQENDPGAFLLQVAKYNWSRNILDEQKNGTGKLAHLLTLETSAFEEKIQQLTALYSTLGKDCQKVLDRFYFERKPVDLIANELNQSTTSVTRVKNRCLVKLRKLYRERKKLRQNRLS